MFFMYFQAFDAKLFDEKEDDRSDDWIVLT